MVKMRGLKSNFADKALLLATIGTTLFVNPWLAYDPINLPKLFILVIAASMLLMAIGISKVPKIFWKSVPTMVLMLCFAGLIGTLSLNSADRVQQIWGVWGRSTGFLTYFSLFILTLAVYLVSSDSFVSKLLRAFTLTSYFITFYTIIQFAQLDPINWSQRLPIATLGNINFTSSFLGLAIVLFLSRILLESTPTPAKIHFLTLSIVNTILILGTGSIQGLAVAAGGILTALFLRTFRSRGSKTAWAIFLPISFLGFLLFLSTAGLGPLGSQLKQATVLYRIDYWLAGWNMFLSSPFWGLGLDSYGDHYREFRSIQAAESGPTRITNTAHNIFLDLLSGGGLILFLPLLILIVVSFWNSVKFSIASQQNEDYPVYLIPPLLVGWLIFANISIGQIGLTSWGFVFIGIGLRTSRNSFLRSSKSDLLKVKKKNLTPRQITGELSNPVTVRAGKLPPDFRTTRFLLLSPILLVGVILGFLPNVADAKVLDAVKRKDVGAMQLALQYPGSTVFHAEKIMQELIILGKYSEARALARRTLERNPRSFQSLVTLATDEELSVRERKSAVEKLILLDPNNALLKEDVKRLGL